jgi:predicted dehydrogenase
VTPERRNVTVGVVGLGYWGPNLARNFAALDGCELRWCCDVSEEARERWRAFLPAARFTADLDDLLNDPALDAVVIATEVPSHAALALAVLQSGRHCFVEKPLAQSSGEAAEVASAARGAGSILMVGHLLEYHPGVAKLKEIVESGELGEIHYVYSNRLNLGKIRNDENALWSLGAHDVSVVLHLFEDEEPVAVLARGESFVREGVEDVVFCYLRFPSGRIAHMHLSWLDPHKMRRITVVGREKMVVFDDMELDQKVTIYDKAPESAPTSYGEWLTRSGDVFSPKIPHVEPLKLECQAFLDLMNGDGDGQRVAADGLKVVRTLERLQASLDG